jgi:hypothetical protein
MRDLKSNLDLINSIVPAARNAGAAVNGTGVDLQGYGGALVVFTAGAVTDGTHTPKVQESDDNSSFSDVAAGDLYGTALVAMTANSIQRISYLGTKRYIRPVITTAGATTGALTSAAVVRGLPAAAPLA